MYLHLLLAFALLAAIIFALPVRWKAWAATAATTAAAVAAAATAARCLATGETLQLARMQGPLFGPESLTVDPLSALFLLIIAISSVSASLYSCGYMKHYYGKKSSVQFSLHYLSLVALVVSMMMVVTSSGGFSFLFGWEMMTIASFLLILFDAQRPEVLRAALTYLIMMHVGFVFLVAGFAGIDAECGTADFDALPYCYASRHTLSLFVIFLIGFGMKAGIFPMHVWLPEAHPAAPSHVSALMSGVMIKTGVYGIIRVAGEITEVGQLHTAGIILLAVGVVTGLWGAVQAAAQNDAKRLLAYSSMENVGIIFIALGVAALGAGADDPVVASIALCGALMHTLNHSLFKSLLYFGAGNLYSQMLTTLLDHFGGAAKRMPVTAALFLLATAAICALPPLNGFAGEFLIYLGMMDSVSNGVNVLYAVGGITALALIGGIVLLAFAKLFGVIFLGSPRHEGMNSVREVEGLRLGAMAIPAAGIIMAGLLPQYAVRVVSAAAAEFSPAAVYLVEADVAPTLTRVSLTAALLIILAALLYTVKVRAQRRRNVTQGPTWGCGFTAPDARMQYTGESFAEGLESLASTFNSDIVEGRVVDKGEIFPPAVRNYNVRHKDRVGRLFSAWWIEMLRMINQRIMRLRTGKINNYIFFALMFLVLVFVLSLFNIL